MIVKEIRDEDFTSYKKPSMVIGFPSCTFKCERECGQKMCQNSSLITAPNIFVPTTELCVRYLSNQITRSVICAGLEPLDSFNDLFYFIWTLRMQYQCNDDIVIYTGYTKEECQTNNWISSLMSFSNIVIKFGRFIPNQKPHYDSVLGIKLASDNQYAERIS